jgi:uncharacterized damage-inducible protein DinB
LLLYLWDYTYLEIREIIMVLARDLKERIQNMQIQIEGSKRVASIEQELEGVKDAMELFISKFNQAQKEEKDIEEEGQALLEEHEEQEREEVEKYAEQDSEEEDDLDEDYGTHGKNVQEETKLDDDRLAGRRGRGRKKRKKRKKRKRIYFPIKLKKNIKKA